MRFSQFLKDKILQISLIMFAIITIEIFLLAYPLENFIKIYILAVIIGLYFISIIVEYLRKKNYYSNIYNLLDELQEKYLITEIIQKPNFVEGKMLKEILEQVNKSIYVKTIKNI